MSIPHDWTLPDDPSEENEWHEKERAKEAKSREDFLPSPEFCDQFDVFAAAMEQECERVFTNCNVCGITLRCLTRYVHPAEQKNGNGQPKEPAILGGSN